MKDNVYLRQSLGWCGIALPLLSCVFNLINGDKMNTISATHSLPTYLLFEGVVVAVGLFLLTYRGYDIGDRAACIVAGIAALMLSFFPTTSSWNFCRLPASVSTVIHLITALMFFFTLAYISAFRFTKACLYTKQKLKRNILYRVCAILMVAPLLICGALDFFKIGNNWTVGVLYIGEWICLWAFGLSWLVKGEVLMRDK